MFSLLAIASSLDQMRKAFSIMRNPTHGIRSWAAAVTDEPILFISPKTTVNSCIKSPMEINPVDNLIKTSLGLDH